MFEETSSFSDNQQMPKVLQLYLVISQYPVLSRKIRQRMREELFGRGIISEDNFEREVHQKAIESQMREGLSDPLFQESPADWDKRVRYIRAHLTDFYFAYNLPYELFEQILADTLHQREPDREVRLTFNPEIAPWEMLFKQGEIYERMSPAELALYNHHLEEIKVVLIKRLMSDQLPFIGVAKRVLSIGDLRRIHGNRIGTGKIGGKAAGMYLAWRCLQVVDDALGADPDGRAQIHMPDSSFIGTDVIYEFFLMNKLEHYMNQKYRPVQEIRACGEHHEPLFNKTRDQPETTPWSHKEGKGGSVWRQGPRG